MMYRIPLAALLVGCTSFETVNEACPALDEVNNLDAITDPDDQALMVRMNCHRRVGKGNKVHVDPLIQEATENHMAYLEANAPIENFFTEFNTEEGFTGANYLDRLRNVGWTQPDSTALNYLLTIYGGEGASDLVGEDHIRLWWDDPFVRGSFMQTNMRPSGVATANYTHVPPQEDLEEIDVSVANWTMLAQANVPAYAEQPKIYPGNGQTDVPGTYIHLSGGTGLEQGVTYGYPITFTIGANERDGRFTAASLFGPSGAIDTFEFDANVGIGTFPTSNTLVLVPIDPLLQGGPYVANVQIESAQGVRNAKTTFYVGEPVERPIPEAVLARELRDGRGPRIEFRKY